MKTDLMERLAGRRFFAHKFGVSYVDGAWPHIVVQDAFAVVRLFGEAKRAGIRCGARVFIRGQSAHHCSMRASLLRNRLADPSALRSAQRELVARIREKTSASRFKEGDLPSLLQHYGLRTSWLDAVDNVFVACWFAAHKVSVSPGGMLGVEQVDHSHGWLYVLSIPQSMRAVDLRTQHHPLSARPHIQHGVSIDSSCSDDPDLRAYVVATIKGRFSDLVRGTLLTAKYLFPPSAADHTLRLLLKHDISGIARSTAEAYGLEPEALGCISFYGDAA